MTNGLAKFALDVVAKCKPISHKIDPKGVNTCSKNFTKWMCDIWFAVAHGFSSTLHNAVDSALASGPPANANAANAASVASGARPSILVGFILLLLPDISCQAIEFYALKAQAMDVIQAVSKNRHRT
jgi:hypothetical protein